MIEPPEGHKDLPHRVGKHYYMQLAEMTGKIFLHDEYCVMAYWLLCKTHETNGGKFES